MGTLPVINSSEFRNKKLNDYHLYEQLNDEFRQKATLLDTNCNKKYSGDFNLIPNNHHFHSIPKKHKYEFFSSINKNFSKSSFTIANDCCNRIKKSNSTSPHRIKENIPSWKMTNQKWESGDIIPKNATRHIIQKFEEESVKAKVQNGSKIPPTYSKGDINPNISKIISTIVSKNQYFYNNNRDSNNDKDNNVSSPNGDIRANSTLTRLKGKKPSYGEDDTHKSNSKRLLFSSKGTVRGIRSKVYEIVRNYIDTNIALKKKLLNEKVTIYTTTCTALRETYTRSENAKTLLNAMNVKYEEKDCYIDSKYTQEVKMLFPTHDLPQLPQIFINTQHLGGYKELEELNEAGILGEILEKYKMGILKPHCLSCGDLNYVMCPKCHGGKRSAIFNSFSQIPLKCVHCEETGLIRCQNCS
ncbi:unnamed protein product [Gordionus sp. m RMFG-2023]|uniref:glutaredoxin domain-containing cysteine-rich protein 1-like n=1 Tax=Gordionus sp. m RMFG-2023 TaxID=3053472 RepID=UPI0030E24446